MLAQITVTPTTIRTGRTTGFPTVTVTATVTETTTESYIRQETITLAPVTVTLADEVDCSRGDVIAAAEDPPEAADQFKASIVWMGEEAMIPGRAYWLKLGTQTVSASVAAPRVDSQGRGLRPISAIAIANGARRMSA